MNQFLIKRLSFGPIYPGDDVDFPVCAEREKRIDHNRDVPALCKAAGVGLGTTVIDCGGFVGDTAWAFAQTGAHVIVYEPFLDSFVCLLYNTRDLPVKAFNAPVGNGEWVQYVYECPGPNFGMRRMKVVPEGTPGAVQTMKLDDILNERWFINTFPAIKLVKIDVEGFEIPAMNGARKLIEQCKPALYVEHYVDGQKNLGFTPQQLVKTIEDLGYDMEMWGSPPRWDWYATPKP